MNRMTPPPSRPGEGSALSPSTDKVMERYLFDFTREVSKFVDNSDYGVEDLTYKVPEIVAYFKHATNDVEQLAEDFWKKYYAGTPKDSIILASQADRQLYPEMLMQLESYGIAKADVVDIEINYTEHSSEGLIECFAFVRALVRSVPNDLPKGCGLLARLGREDRRTRG